MATVNDLLMVSICETTNVSELVDKLTQMKMSLTDKRAILKELDEEILEISDERDLNEDVEQADNFMSTLRITQIKHDHFLNNLERQRPLKDNVLDVSLAGSTVSSPIVDSPPIQNQADSESSTIPVFTSQPIINPGSHRPHVKLTKLGLPNFNGDYSR
ncbi:hypothetical protein SNE40_019791 [Patella caerulea]|uniref:Uncharacterized protein n=1 Tax=Patella caerulea TaxID=87958 RepID=A0AAN8GD52_PATCE